MVKMVIPLVTVVQILPTNGTIGRTPNTRSVLDRNSQETCFRDKIQDQGKNISGLEKKVTKPDYFAYYHKIGAIMFKTRRDTAGVRRASHCGSWYSDDGEEFVKESSFNVQYIKKTRNSFFKKRENERRKFHQC